MSEFTYADNEQVLKITEYAVIDIDGDGYNEIVAYLDAKIGLVEVFHYEDGQVYGYQLGYTSVKQISAEGVFEEATTASEIYHYKLEFDKDKSTAVVLCHIEGSDYFIGEKKVTKDEYKAFEEELYREKATLYDDLSLLTHLFRK